MQLLRTSSRHYDETLELIPTATHLDARQLTNGGVLSVGLRCLVTAGVATFGRPSE